LENAEESFDYFVDYYAANSAEAFKARVSTFVSDAVCQNFLSANYPSGGKLIDELTNPASPPQFYGNFQEIPYTTATNPPLSHYKVYYHIYAGENARAYYKVYLKGSSSSSYYQDTSSDYYIDSGYIAVGEEVDKSPDFVATSGYKQLCISVNGQEECGFNQVSTSYAVNYVTDKYAAEQANTTNIKTETECISGSISAYTLLNFNLGEALESVANPSIYDYGIIRICATKNPGQGTDANANAVGSRWVDVGYCDNENMRCWLDTDSVKAVIKSTDIENSVLESFTETQLNAIKNASGWT
jgi:hypothetical protein